MTIHAAGADPQEIAVLIERRYEQQLRRARRRLERTWPRTTPDARDCHRPTARHPDNVIGGPDETARGGPRLGRRARRTPNHCRGRHSGNPDLLIPGLSLRNLSARSLRRRTILGWIGHYMLWA